MLETWMKRIAGANMSPQMRKVYDDATEMLRNTEKIPVIIYCCIDQNRSSKSEEVQYASILPAVQNLMLAAHAVDLGSCLTVYGSTATRGEPEVKRILGIPDHVKIACLIYLGYPTRKHGPPKRNPSRNTSATTPGKSTNLFHRHLFFRSLILPGSLPQLQPVTLRIPDPGKPAVL